MTVDEVRMLAMQLEASDRAALATDLLHSLDDDEADSDAESAWAAEIEARAEAYAAGEVLAEDTPTVIKRLKDQIRRV